MIEKQAHKTWWCCTLSAQTCLQWLLLTWQEHPNGFWERKVTLYVVLTEIIQFMYQKLTFSREDSCWLTCKYAHSSFKFIEMCHFVAGGHAWWEILVHLYNNTCCSILQEEKSRIDFPKRVQVFSVLCWSEMWSIELTKTNRYMNG